MPTGALQQGDNGDDFEDDADVDDDVENDADVDGDVDDFVQGRFPRRHATGDDWSRRDSPTVGRLLRMFSSSGRSSYDVLLQWTVFSGGQERDLSSLVQSGPRDYQVEAFPVQICRVCSGNLYLFQFQIMPLPRNLPAPPLFEKNWQI